MEMGYFNMSFSCHSKLKGAYLDVDPQKVMHKYSNKHYGRLHRCTFDQHLPISTALAITLLLSAAMNLMFLDSTPKGNYAVFVFLRLVYFTWHNVV